MFEAAARAVTRLQSVTLEKRYILTFRIILLNIYIYKYTYIYIFIKINIYLYIIHIYI